MEKKKHNWFIYIITSLFIIYLGLYIFNSSEYYDGNMRKKIEFTDEQIERFEKDVKNGVNIDLADYLEEQNKNYTNRVSKMGYRISMGIDKLVNRGLKDFVKVLAKFLT